MAEYLRRWKLEHPERLQGYCRNATQKRNSKPETKLNHAISTAILTSLMRNKNGRHWESLVGFTLDQLKKHLEERFLPGMSWENRSEWHIDHRIPIAAFNFKTPDDIDFKRCWALKNLQPLWAQENRLKRDKIIGAFQPSLAIQI
jgi:hypothetical protein